MRKNKHILLFLLDLGVVISSYYIALSIYSDFSTVKMALYANFQSQLVVVALVYAIVFFVFDFNRIVWRHISIEEGIKVVFANAVASVIIATLVLLNVIKDIPYSVIAIAFLITTLAHGLVRFSYRAFRYLYIKIAMPADGKRILIYGAGQAGSIIIREYSLGDSVKGNIIGIVDDSDELQGKYIFDKKVLGKGTDLQYVVNRYDVDEVIVAMPSVPLKKLRSILETCFKTGAVVKSLGSLEDLINGEPLRHSLNKVDIVDLLDRSEIKLDDSEIASSVAGESILVTGAAGSIGSELVRQIIRYEPNKLVLLDISENGLYAIQQEIKIMQREGTISSNINLKYHVCSIRDKNSLERIFMENEFDRVFHAAAHKHVPLMETSPAEALKNNIFGTHNLIELAKQYKVKKFLNVSTDKAVNPTNVMGATKRFNEMVLQSQEPGYTKFLAVRFGNVLGSNGSVVPLFKEQIASGGPVVVTHPEIIRYFMTIPEAVSLILEAATFANGGEIFVLDMGRPVKILDLAKRIITLSGYEPNRDIFIEYSGLRPGEKLYEELLMSEEGLETTANDLIHVAKPMAIDRGQINLYLQELRDIVDRIAPEDEIIAALERAVPTFKHEPNGIALVDGPQDLIETPV